jgi:hypothetical protein
VADGPATPLQEASVDREARIVEAQERHHGLDLTAIEKLGIDSMQPHSIAAPRIGIALTIRVIEIEDATLRDHGVVVQVLLQPFPELHGQLIERVIAR